MNEKIMVTKSYLPPIEEYMDEISDVWDSCWLTNNGPKHMKFQRELERYLKVEDVSLFTNGHLALDAGVKALELKGEIITTPFTFVSTTHAISMNNITPVFCDIKLSDYTMDENLIESLITEKTVAIMPVHVYGMPCNIKKISEIAEKYNLKVIYDAAHCFGVEIDGVGIGKYGDVSMFSFHATKVFHTIEGGALTFSNNELKRKLDLVKNFGILNEDEVVEIGFNAKMSEFQAVMGILNLKYINENIKKRKAVVNSYFEHLKDIKGIRLLEYKEGIKYNYSYFPIFIGEEYPLTRNELYDKLKENNIFPRKYFYPLITEMECYSYLPKRQFPNAELASKSVMTLPLYSDMKTQDIIRICEVIKKYKY